MIRQARTTDLPLILRIMKTMIEEIGYIQPMALREAIKRRELLIDVGTGSFCHYHTRRDGVSVVYEIAVPMIYRGKGLGRKLLEQVPLPVRLKCPSDNASNRFYEAVGFKLVKMEQGKKKRLNTWEKHPDATGEEE